MSDELEVFEIIFECTQCKLVATETTTDLFTTLYQRCCGECGCGILKLRRCKKLFGGPAPDPEKMFERKPEDE